MTDHPAPPLLFLDTETIHLDPFLGSVWEIAWMRLDDEVPETHLVQPMLSLADPEALEVGGYEDRWDPARATPRDILEVALADALTGRPALAGSNPGFDERHLLANWPSLAGRWYHHPLDVPTLICGSSYEGDPEPPWRLSQAARWAGLDPDDYPRHTAAGDVLLTRDLYRTWRSGA